MSKRQSDKIIIKTIRGMCFSMIFLLPSFPNEVPSFARESVPDFERMSSVDSAAAVFWSCDQPPTTNHYKPLPTTHYWQLHIHTYVYMSLRVRRCINEIRICKSYIDSFRVQLSDTLLAGNDDLCAVVAQDACCLLSDQDFRFHQHPYQCSIGLSQLLSIMVNNWWLGNIDNNWQYN